MKALTGFRTMAVILLVGGIVFSSCGQDKSKRPSPPASVTQKINTGTTVLIDYSQPGLKGRTIGETVEPMQGKVWRAGANEATIFQIDKDVSIEGKALPAGKYSLFTLNNGSDWTLIFNKNWDIWGTQYDANKDTDALRVNVKGGTSATSTERLSYTIDKNGKVDLLWGNLDISFKVQ